MNAIFFIIVSVPPHRYVVFFWSLLCSSIFELKKIKVLVIFLFFFHSSSKTLLYQDIRTTFCKLSLIDLMVQNTGFYCKYRYCIDFYIYIPVFGRPTAVVPLYQCCKSGTGWSRNISLDPELFVSDPDPYKQMENRYRVINFFTFLQCCGSGSSFEFSKFRIRILAKVPDPPADPDPTRVI